MFGHNKEAYAATDDLLAALCWCLIQAKIDNLATLEQFIETFDACKDTMG